METDARRRRGRGLDRRALLIAAIAVLLVSGGLVAFAAARRSAHSPAASAQAARTFGSVAATLTALSTAPVPAPARVAPPVSKPKVAASTTPPAPAVAKGPSATIPEKMKRLLPGSKQLVVVTGAALGAKDGTVQIFELTGGRWVQVFSTPSRFGQNGLTNGVTRVEGSNLTPTGIWWMGGFVWGGHASPPSGTRMPYRQITENSWWSGQHDASYNMWVESSSHVGGEHLIGAAGLQYEFAVDSGYNALPNERVMGRGSGIFLHVFDPPWYHGGYSAGCIGISRDAIIQVFRILDPAKKPTFAVGTTAAGTPTSIWAY